VQLSAKSNKLYQLVFDIGYKNKLCDF
jgi:hypothetical protein